MACGPATFTVMLITGALLMLGALILSGGRRRRSTPPRGAHECGRCRHPNPGGAHYCARCGQALDHDEASPTG